MGLYDRDYVRDDQPQGYRVRAPQSAVVTLILINVGVFLVNFLFFSAPGPNKNWLMEQLACSVRTLTEPWRIWQLLTAGFAHAPESPWHIVFNMFVLWMFGREAERVLGKWEFVRYYLAAIVLGSLTFCLRQWLFVGVNSPFFNIGASGATTAVVIFFILRNPNADFLFMMFLPMKAWVAGVLMIALDMLGTRGVYAPGFADPDIAYDVHIAGAMFALAYFYFGWNFGYLVPSRLADGLSAAGRWVRRGPKLRVHSPEDREMDDEQYSELDERADAILAKIDREGMNSLTPQEHRILEDYSRRMRQKHR
jgi:membrane associated rhomboid family serine protease